MIILVFPLLLKWGKIRKMKVKCAWARVVLGLVVRGKSSYCIIGYVVLESDI